MAGRHPSLRRKEALQAAMLGLLGTMVVPVWAQGPTPETGNTIFPGGGLASYAADFVFRKAPAGVTSIPTTILPTTGVSQLIQFSWGVRRDIELMAATSVDTNRLSLSSPPPELRAGGSGLGDSMLLVKYRFLRRDSERGTTQASLTLGPKLPTGRTGLRNGFGNLLPASLQPGSGSTDLFVNLSGTYTGLFGLERLVADGTVDYLDRSEGTQRTRLGGSLHARLYVPYRPYESHSVGKEWWIGPEVVWEREGYTRIGGVRQADSGGDVLSLGGATYFSPFRASKSGSASTSPPPRSGTAARTR